MLCLGMAECLTGWIVRCWSRPHALFHVGSSYNYSITMPYSKSVIRGMDFRWYGKSIGESGSVMIAIELGIVSIKVEFTSVHAYLLCGSCFIGDAGWVITGALVWAQR